MKLLNAMCTSISYYIYFESGISEEDEHDQIKNKKSSASETYLGFIGMLIIEF